MCVQEETRYLIYDNIKKGFICDDNGGISSAPECAELYVKREHAERELIIIINDESLNSNIIMKCKVRYEVIEETEEEIKADIKSRIKYKDNYCYDCFYEKNESYDSGQECANTEISKNLKKRYLDN